MEPLPPLTGTTRDEEKPIMGPHHGEVLDYTIFEETTKKEMTNVDMERDCLDDALELMKHSQESENNIDMESMSVAAKLMENGDEESVLKAHRLLTSCGAHLGIWSIGKIPDEKLKKKAQNLDKRGFFAPDSKIANDFKDIDFDKLQPFPAWDHGSKKKNSSEVFTAATIPRPLSSSSSASPPSSSSSSKDDSSPPPPSK